MNLPPLDAIVPAERGWTLIAHFRVVWERDVAGLLVLRLAASNSVAAERLNAIFAGQVAPALVRALAKPDAAGRAALTLSQLLGLALCRYVLKLLPVVSMSDADIVDAVGETVQCCLGAS